MPIPVEYKACATTSDCTQQLIYLNCCGSQEAIGLAVSEVTAFEAFEKACNHVVPACGCAAAPTVAEDGKTAAPGSIQVACTAGACMTSVP
jgi:hypothetical protein